jgi:hypothetical protein
MTASWLAYVPYHVAEDILHHPAQDPVGREKRFDVMTLGLITSAAAGPVGNAGHARGRIKRRDGELR